MKPVSARTSRRRLTRDTCATISGTPLSKRSTSSQRNWSVASTAPMPRTSAVYSSARSSRSEGAASVAAGFRHRWIARTRSSVVHPSGGRKLRAISSAVASGLASGIRLAMNVSAMLGTDGMEIAERWTANHTLDEPRCSVRSSWSHDASDVLSHGREPEHRRTPRRAARSKAPAMLRLRPHEHSTTRSDRAEVWPLATSLRL